MIVDEGMLVPFRGADGLWPLLEGGVKPSPTYKAFREAWSQAERGHRAVPVLAFIGRVPSLPATRRWLALEHQCAGHACGNVPMIATVLEARDGVQAAFDRIAAENYYACNGWFEGPEIDGDVTRRYLDRVAELGLSCGEPALGRLCEAFYPMDATPAALRLVATDADDLLPLLDRPDAQPLILLLSENSD